jgi:ABC-type lipoprotein export system ATPase subunit
VRKAYVSGAGRIDVLRGLSLDVAPGDTCAILGPSGSGKSTLLYALAGLETPDAGRVFVDGEEMSALDETRRAALRARAIGFVLQDHGLLPYLTAAENVRVANVVAGRYPPGPAHERAIELLAQLGLRDRAGHLPSALSGGERQRVAIARALFLGPKILLCDEPTGNLDAETATQVLDVLLEAHARNRGALVMVTHNADAARRFSRRLRFTAGALVAEA